MLTLWRIFPKMTEMGNSWHRFRCLCTVRDVGAWPGGTICRLYWGWSLYIFIHFFIDGLLRSRRYYAIQSVSPSIRNNQNLRIMLGIQFGLLWHRPIFESRVGDRNRSFFSPAGFVSPNKRGSLGTKFCLVREVGGKEFSREPIARFGRLRAVQVSMC